MAWGTRAGHLAQGYRPTAAQRGSCARIAEVSASTRGMRGAILTLFTRRLPMRIQLIDGDISAALETGPFG